MNKKWILLAMKKSDVCKDVSETINICIMIKINLKTTLNRLIRNVYLNK